VRHIAVPVQAFAHRFVHDPGDVAYCWALSFDPTFFARLCYQGFLSICSFPAKLTFLLMPWIAPTRAVMEYGGMHVSKQLRKRARRYVRVTRNTRSFAFQIQGECSIVRHRGKRLKKAERKRVALLTRSSGRYRMTVNADFEGVVAGCVAQHGEAWLYEPMRRLLRQCWCDPAALQGAYDAAAAAPAAAAADAAARGRRAPHAAWRADMHACGFRVVTFELWDSATGELVRHLRLPVVVSCRVLSSSSPPSSVSSRPVV
jgi:hypothetical protein